MLARRLAALVALFAVGVCPWSLLASAAAADEIPETQILANAFRSSWLRFGINSGRITLDGSRGINVTQSSGGTERRERLSVRMTGGDPVVDYELAAQDQELTVNVASHNRVQIRRKPKGQSQIVPMEYEQPAQGPLTLHLGGKDQEQVIRGPSIWHLFVCQPEVCKEHLLPLLKLLHRDWDFNKTAAEIEANLVLLAREQKLPDKRKWGELVEQLGDGRFSKREGADRQLREAGMIVVTYLQQLDPGRLDAEQQFRVKRIIAALSEGDGNDTPEQVAAWLAGDPAIWLALLSRQDPATRHLAVKQLAALLGESVNFDPEAPPETRAKQIEQLRTRSGGK